VILGGVSSGENAWAKETSSHSIGVALEICFDCS
jgi:hypothetical protein